MTVATINRGDWPAVGGVDLPPEWAWVTLGDVAHLNFRDRTIPVPAIDELVPYVSMKSIDETRGIIAAFEQRTYAAARKSSVSLVEGDVLIAKVDPCLKNGKAAIVKDLPGSVGYCSSTFHVLRPGPDVLAEWLFFYLRQARFRTYASSNIPRHSGSWSSVPADILKDYPLPLPPLSEQERIVQIIERLMGHIEQAEDTLKKGRPLLAQYRPALLEAAFRGKLVALLSTDMQYEDIPSTWKWVKVSDICLPSRPLVQAGSSIMRAKDFQSEGVPVITVGSVQWGGFDTKALRFLPEHKASHFTQYRVHPGDLVFTRSGSVGRAAVVGSEQAGWIVSSHVFRVPINHAVCLPEYLALVFEGAPHTRKQILEASEAHGTTRPGFNTELLLNLDIPLPPLTEQARIVVAVHDKLTNLTELTRTADVLFQELVQLRETILKRAFAGELVSSGLGDTKVKL
jgi:type I restriction enzyme, S subunit